LRLLQLQSLMSRMLKNALIQEHTWLSYDQQQVQVSETSMLQEVRRQRCTLPNPSLQVTRQPRSLKEGACVLSTDPMQHNRILGLPVPHEAKPVISRRSTGIC